jgi:hypothetical protein
MPRFDGTGPRGDGPMTGRGEGYCILELPESGRPARGYAGVEGAPVQLGAPWLRRAVWSMPIWGGGAAGQRAGAVISDSSEEELRRQRRMMVQNRDRSENEGR